jgi:type II secretory pathway pseudopilin PulG
VVIVVLGILAALAVPTFSTVKDKSADSIALKNAQAVQRDFDAQAAIAASDSSVTPSAYGLWSINGHYYSYDGASGVTNITISDTLGTGKLKKS